MLDLPDYNCCGYITGDMFGLEKMEFISRGGRNLQYILYPVLTMTSFSWKEYAKVDVMINPT